LCSRVFFPPQLARHTLTEYNLVSPFWWVHAGRFQVRRREERNEGGSGLEEQKEVLNVLILEDSETDTKRILRELRSSGFSPTWERVDRLVALHEALSIKNWDVVVSDPNVPGLSPPEALGATKDLAPNVPFILVSGTIREELVVEAMRLGAADYVTKDHLQRLGPAIVRELSVARARQLASHQLFASQELEKRRIARALHDELGQLLTALQLTVEAIGRRRGAERAKAVEEARALVTEATAQARNLSVELWPTILEDLGLAAALRSLGERHAHWSGFHVTFEEGSHEPIPFVVQAACFRMAQQALTNVARHAHARHVQIQLRGRPGRVELEVSDDGKGFDVPSERARAMTEGSLGLLGMQERALLAGSRLSIESGADRGTTVRVTFQLPGRTSP